MNAAGIQAMSFINMIHVPEAGTDGSAAGATKWFSMGSAAVPMGTQDKHDLLLRITPTRSTREEGDRQPQDVRILGSSGRGHRTEELRYRAGPELGSSPSQLRTLLPDKWQCIWDPLAALVVNLIYKNPASRTEPPRVGLSATPSCPLQGTGTGGGGLQETSTCPADSSARRGCSARVA